jgi:uncharacterized membrane protein YphA (DoxX/SURF4 family)
LSELLLAARWVLALVFISAGTVKLSRNYRDEFFGAVRTYTLVPGRFAGVVGAGLPWLEIGLGVFFALGFALVITAAIAALTLAAFASAIAWDLIQGHRFACGCGLGKDIAWSFVVRDALLCFLSLSIALGPSGLLAIWPGWDTPLVSGPWQTGLPIPLLTILLAVASRFPLATSLSVLRPLTHRARRRAQ